MTLIACISGVFAAWIALCVVIALVPYRSPYDHNS